MKVTDIRVTPVLVPLEAPLRWSMGVETGTARAIIEVETDEGVVGIGETYGGNEIVHAVETARPFVLGIDPLQTGLLQHRLGVFCISYETQVTPVARAGIEMACLDAAGKALGQPVHALLGGAVRDRVEVAAYLFYRYTGERGVGGEETPEAIAARTEELVARHGFRAIKLKGGVFPPYDELSAVRLLRERFPDSPLRWDPNAGWATDTAIRVARRLDREGLDLEYLEDPTANLEGMSLVHQAVPAVPLATNMCLVAPEQLAPGIRMHSVDVILADVHYWGGFRANQKMAAVAEAFGLGVGMHSDRELGVSTAAMVHLAAALPNLTHAIDSHYPDQVDDVITTPWEFEDGCLPVPRGPGLGVDLDRDKVEQYHRLYLERGATNEFYDPWRPAWVPALPVF